MTDTTQEGFDVVAQSGSGIAWSGISNMPYPTEGEASASLTASVQNANTLQFKIPHEAVNIPIGARVTNIDFRILIKKSGATTNLSWSGRTNLSTATAWTTTQTLDGTYQGLALSGDLAYWKIYSISDTQAIDKLKDGSLYFTVSVSTTSAAVCDALAKQATVIISYHDIAGERAAIIATCF